MSADTDAAYQKVLGLRPSNTVVRLGVHSRIPILNPRDLLPAVPEDSALVCVPVYSDAMIAGVLRASRDEDAVIGLSCPVGPLIRDLPDRFVDKVRIAAEEVRHERPLFLQAGPFRIGSTRRDELDSMVSGVHRFVDAGFTLVTLDASAVGDVEEAIRIYGAMAQPAVERELGVEITVPTAENGAVDFEALGRLVEGLRAGGTTPLFIRVPGATYALEPSPREAWQLDLAVIKGVGELAQALGSALSVEEEGSRPDRLADGWVSGGVRKADVQEAAARLVQSGLTREQSDTLARMAREQHLPARRLLSDVAQSSDAKARLRIEALAWAMATDVLAAVGARGSSSRTIAFLAQSDRY